MAKLEKDLTHYLKKINFVLDNIKDLQDKRTDKKLSVLDVGCGTGNISLEVAELGCEVLGIDLDKESIDYANKRNNLKNCKFKVANAHDLKLKDKFDVIIASEVLEHLKHPENLIDFVNKNLDKKGFLFLSIPNGFGPSEISVTPRRVIGRLLKKLGLFEKARKIRHSLVKDSIKKARKSFGVDTLNNYGEGALHEQFFSIHSLKRLLNKYNFRLTKRQNSFVFLGTFPFYYLFSKSKLLQKYDCKLADNLPSFLSSGWSFIVKFKN